MPHPQPKAELSNPLLVGGGASALNLYQELEGMRRSIGYDFRGFISLGNGTGAQRKTQAFW
ncbi:MAG: hypothetical protein R3B47_08910 [Bacteroidia bacterium]